MDWQSCDVYADPFRAAQAVCDEYTRDFSAACRNAMRDLGPHLFAQAVAEVRQDRMADKVRNPAALLNSICNRYRNESGLQERHSRRAQG